MSLSFAMTITIQLFVGLLFSSISWPQEATPAATNEVPSALRELSADHATLSVEDLDRETTWYERVLGFRVTKTTERETLTVRQLRNSNYRFDLIKYRGSSRTPVNPIYLQQGWVRIALNVPDLSAALVALKGMKIDATASGNDGRGGPVVVLLHDPEGNEVEIFDKNVPH